MPALSDLLSWADNKRRVVGRNIADSIQNPRDYLALTAERGAQTLLENFQDPMNFVGGGIGRVKALGKAGEELGGTYPTQASMVGNLRSMNLVSDSEASKLYNLGRAKNEAVDPELLGLIEDEMVRRKGPRRPINDLLDVRAD